MTQAIRLEHGDAQLPPAIAGELGNLTLPLMNLGKGELSNILVKLETPAANVQSVLVGSIAPGETKQAQLTFTPFEDKVGTHSGTMLSVLPVHSQHRGRFFLPFLDDDPKTAEIISNVILFAEDRKLKDPTILEQITK